MSYPFAAALLDTSVAVKWFVPEEDSDRALALQQAYLQNEVRLSMPDVLLLELTNALRYSGLSEEKVLEDLDALIAFDLAIVPFNSDVLKLSVSLSLDHDLAVYDAYFLALAQELEIPLITADRKMLSRLTTGHGALDLKSL